MLCTTRTAFAQLAIDGWWMDGWISVQVLLVLRMKSPLLEKLVSAV